jgi:hypothetical protein
MIVKCQTQPGKANGSCKTILLQSIRNVLAPTCASCLHAAWRTTGVGIIGWAHEGQGIVQLVTAVQKHSFVLYLSTSTNLGNK